MRARHFWLSILFALTGAVLASASLAFEVDETSIDTPAAALDALMDGNERFVTGKPMRQDFARQIEKTADGQAPYAAVLSCLDSRVPVELIFDQGIGDIFVGRVAGNIEDVHILGSFEFAKHIKGTRLLMVLGHTNCGAVAGACAEARLGSLTELLSEIRPAIHVVEERHGGAASCEAPYLDEMAEENVRRTLRDIREKSPVISDLEAAGSIKLVGAMYDVSSGRVTLL